MEDTLANFGNKRVGLVRLDSGFCQKDIMGYLEEKNLQYIIAARFTHPIQALIDKREAWISVDDGIEICNKIYQANSWQKPRRIVMVRQRIKERPNAAGSTLSLFAEDEIHRNFRYSAYFTNQEASATGVWRSYRARSDAENRIKELKQDFGINSFVIKAFYATEVVILFAMFAYNLMSVFRIFVLQEKTQRTLSTLRYIVFAVGAYFEKVNDTLKLKILLIKQRRKWFDSLWDYPLDLSLKIPNA